jgi:very-short-patch-repair endonuclease
MHRIEKRKAFKKKLEKSKPRSQKNAHQYIFKVARKVFNFKVDSEKMFDPYFIDIYIRPLKIGIEIDGGIHDHKEGYDNNRDLFLWEKYGVKIYRFKNEDIGTAYFKGAIWKICFDGSIQIIKNAIDIAEQNNIDASAYGDIKPSYIFKRY